MGHLLWYCKAGQVVLLSRGRYYKVGYFLLHCEAGITKGGTFITKRGRYCKVGQLLQSRAVQGRGDVFIKSHFLKKDFRFACLIKKQERRSCLTIDNEARI